MDFASFFMGVGCSLLVMVIAISYYEFRYRYVFLDRDEYEAMKREALIAVQKVRKLEAEDIHF